MKITILGCGTSTGVPLIGNDWGACDPEEPKNRRLRPSILVEEGDTAVLVDTSPDMRQQLLDNHVNKLDAVLYTHAHADHCHGIDDLRTVNWMMQKSIDIYATPVTMNELRARFPYVMTSTDGSSYYKPSVIPHEVHGAFSIGDLSILPFDQDHGFSRSTGYRFGSFAYSTDVHKMDDAGFEVLRGIRVWVVDSLRREPHNTHSHLAQTLAWIERVRPQRAILTHMNHSMDYRTLCHELPPGVEPAFDGMVIEC